MLFWILAGGTGNINILMKTQSVHGSVEILESLHLPILLFNSLKEKEGKPPPFILNNSRLIYKEISG